MRRAMFGAGIRQSVDLKEFSQELERRAACRCPFAANDVDGAINRIRYRHVVLLLLRKIPERPTDKPDMARDGNLHCSSPGI